LLFTYFGANPKAAVTILYPIGITLGYIGNRSFTFSYENNLHVSFKYLLTHISGYILNVSLLYLFVDTLGYSHQIVQAIAILIVAVYLFIIFKFFVFTSSLESK